MGHTPPEFRAPRTLSSPTALPDETADLRREATALRVTRMPDSLRRAAESRWTPAAITTLLGVVASVLIAWLARPPDSETAHQARETAQELAKAKTTLETQATELASLRVKLGELRDELGKANTAAADRTNWEDVAWCAVGVKSPSGCAEIELLPRPMRGSTAPPIQVRARAPPN
jgi:hypothetical protein